jgi:hypothetical protein
MEVGTSILDASGHIDMNSRSLLNWPLPASILEKSQGSIADLWRNARPRIQSSRLAKTSTSPQPLCRQRAALRPVAGELLFRPRFLRIPRLATILRCAIWWDLPGKDSSGPSWLTFLGHMKDSLWSIDLFTCESATLRTHWVLVGPMHAPAVSGIISQYIRLLRGLDGLTVRSGKVEALRPRGPFSEPGPPCNMAHENTRDAAGVALALGPHHFCRDAGDRGRVPSHLQ